MNAFAPDLVADAALLSFPTGLGQSDTHAETLEGGKPNPSADAGKPYTGITGRAIGALVRNPQTAPKTQARWFMPSTYVECDARVHEVQRRRGEFWFLVLDVDQNNLSLDGLQAALVIVVPACTTLVYSTRSATESDRKWRALVPLATAVSGTHYPDAQNAFFNLLEDASQGVLIPDRRLARPGQLVYLPNRGDFYEWNITKGVRLALTPDHPILLRHETNRAARADAEREAQRLRDENAARRKTSASSEDASPVDHFNERHTVADLLAKYGYVQADGSSDWRSPLQRSGSFATRDCGKYWISLSGSDADAGIGAETINGHRHGDAFDLFVYFGHGGDFNLAVAAYARGAGVGGQLSGGFNWQAGCTKQERQRQKHSADGGGAQSSERATRFISAAILHRHDIPPRTWAVEGWIPGRTVTLFNGDGGAGKSLLAGQLAVATVLARSWMGLATTPGSVVYLSAEDDMDELHRRLADIAKSEDVGLDALTDLSLLSLAGEDALLACERKDRALTPTPLFEEMEAEVAAIQPRLFIADTLADLHPSNENDRAQARQFIGIMRGLAIRQKCAVVILAHPSLTGLSSGTGTSGSTAWNNSARSRLYLQRVISEGYEADPDARKLCVKKSNYGRTGAEITMRSESGVFVVDERPSELERMADGAKAERVFLKLLREYSANGRFVSAQPSSTYAPTQFASNPGAEGVRKRALKAAMENMFAAKRITIATHGTGAKTRSHIVEVARV